MKATIEAATRPNELGVEWCYMRYKFWDYYRAISGDYNEKFIVGELLDPGPPPVFEEPDEDLGSVPLLNGFCSGVKVFPEFPEEPVVGPTNQTNHDCTKQMIIDDGEDP